MPEDRKASTVEIAGTGSAGGELTGAGHVRQELDRALSVPSEISLLVFDLDGTLVDSSGDIAASVNHVRRSFGLGDLPMDRIMSHLGEGVRQLIERCFPEVENGDFEADIAAVVNAFREHYNAHCTVRTAPYAGVVETLENFKGRYTYAILTNKYRAAAVTILEILQLLDYFKIVVGGDGPCLKPCPEGLQSILDELKVSASQALMIGDHHTDLEAGRRAGVRTVFCEYGFGVRGNEHPDAAIAEFADLSSILSKMSVRSENKHG